MNFGFYTLCYYDPGPSLREVHRAFWTHVSHLRGWLPPWKQIMSQRHHTSAAPSGIPHPLRILSVSTVRRERFQWKRKMVQRYLKPLIA